MKYIIFLFIFIIPSESQDLITPSPGKSCQNGKVCATKKSCSFWVEKEESVKNLPRSSSQFKQYVSEARAETCNQKERALCCPTPTIEEKTASPGSNCPTGEICAVKDTCPYWKNKEKNVKNLSRSDSKFKQYISEVTGAICNRKEKAVCCPGSKDADLSPRNLDNLDVESPSYIPQAGECGLGGLPSNIFGGEDTRPGEFPFLVLLGYTAQRLSQYVNRGKRQREDYTIWVCGGTLINHWYVVTAGHCVKGRKDISMVRAGEHKVTGISELYGSSKAPGVPDVQEFKISKSDIIAHEGYKFKRRNIENDIALIRLPRKITTNTLTQVACLPLPGNSSFAGFQSNWKGDSIGEKATVVGWGYSCYENGTRSFCQEDKENLGIGEKIQQKLLVPIKTNSVCTSKGFRISEKQLCAGGEFGKSACRGDSGGGLFINDPGKENNYRKKEPWYLFGVVSFGNPNCEASVPEVYVRVSDYTDWIIEKIRSRN